MPSKVKLYCEECGDLVFDGYEYEYEYPPDSGNIKSDVEGNYVYGAGKCEACGRALCAYCGGFFGKVCKNCADKD